MRVVYASSSSVYGAAERYPLREDSSRSAGLPVRGTEAGVRVAGERLWVLRRPRRGGPELLLGLRAPATAGHGVLHAFQSLTHCRPYTFSATDARRGTSRTSETSSTPRCGPWNTGPVGALYNVGGGCEVSLLDALALCERIVGQPLDVHRVRAPPETPAARAPTSARHQRELGWTPSRRWRMAYAPRPRASPCGSPRRGAPVRAVEQPSGRHARAAPAAALAIQSFRPHGGRCRAPARASVAAARGARRPHGDLTRARSPGMPGATEPIAGSVVRRTPLAGESPLASLAYVADSPRAHRCAVVAADRPRPRPRGAVPGHIALGARLLGLPCLVTALGARASTATWPAWRANRSGGSGAGCSAGGAGSWR